MFNEKVLQTIFALVLFVVVIFVMGWVLRVIISPPTATLPPDDVPVISETPTTVVNSLALLGSVYVPSQTVYSDSATYDKESVQLALNGKFATARLVVEGAVKDEGPHFISVNVSTQSGVLNGVRSSYNRLDLQQTQARGGVFTKDSGIKFTLDLLGETSLATSNKEFLDTKQLSKMIRFWNYLKQIPPTVTRVLIAPFNQNGVYGGASITNLRFEYTCEGSSKCAAAICRYDEIGYESQCIRRNFGEAAEQTYRRSVGI